LVGIFLWLESIIWFNINYSKSENGFSKKIKEDLNEKIRD